MPLLDKDNIGTPKLRYYYKYRYGLENIKVIQLLAELHYRLIHWDLSPEDRAKYKMAKRNLLKKTVQNLDQPVLNEKIRFDYYRRYYHITDNTKCQRLYDLELSGDKKGFKKLIAKYRNDI
jgi:hypothetical protein